MGTNFYLFTNDKNLKETYFKSSKLKIVDEPDFGYMLHIAKTSHGWLPLFQAHENIKSVKVLLKIMDKQNVRVFSEYGDEYSKEDFIDRVVSFNGGFDGAKPKTPVKRDYGDPYCDKNMPPHTPVSHFEYANGRYSSHYFKDEDGYEFTEEEFS